MENTNDRELVLTRVFNAPVDLVWEVWSQPEHIAHWWGPDGFTCTVHKMDLRPGGEWNLVLHGPDGTDFDNQSFFREVIPMKKLVYEHVSYPWIMATIDFEAQGEQTKIRWHMLFESAEVFHQVVRVYGAAEGQKQNAEKLATYLNTLR